MKKVLVTNKTKAIVILIKRAITALDIMRITAYWSSRKPTTLKTSANPTIIQNLPIISIKANYPLLAKVLARAKRIMPTTINIANHSQGEPKRPPTNNDTPENRIEPTPNIRKRNARKLLDTSFRNPVATFFLRGMYFFRFLNLEYCLYLGIIILPQQNYGQHVRRVFSVNNNSMDKY